MSILLRTCFVLALAVSVAFIPASSPAAPAPAKEEGVLECFKVEPGGDWLLLPVLIDGKKYDFLLDTGCGCNAFDPTLVVGECKGRITAQGPGGCTELNCFDTPIATVGHFRLSRKNPVPAIDFWGFREQTGHEIFGIIGMSFLRRHILRIDFDAGEVVFLTSVGESPGQKFPLSRDEGGGVSLRAKIAGSREEKFLLDTGDTFGPTCSLDANLFDILLDKKRLKLLEETTVYSISGASRARLGQTEGFALGDFIIKDTIVGETRCGSWSKLNLLGLGFLSRFVVTFDFPNDAIYLKKGKQFDRPDVIAKDLSGLAIRRKEGKLVVKSVETGSAAEVAGFKTGDIFVTIDDRKAEEVSLLKFRQMFSTIGKKYRIVIRRNEKETELVLILKSDMEARDYPDRIESMP